MDFLREIEKRVLIHDGSKGYMLQKMGLKGGECGELWNLTNKDAVKSVYQAYFEAGSDVIQTNTFMGNRLHLKKFGLEDKVYEINYWGVKLAKKVAGDKVFVSASIGPAGMLLEPSGELTFEMAYETFKEQVKAVVDGGADIINFETFTDIAELRAAYLAARDTTDLPVICSLAFESNGHTLMGTDPFTAVAVLKSLGVDMVGANCSFGPEHMAGIVKKMYDAGAGYLSVKPNAGLPEVSDGCAIYNETPENFARMASVFAAYGARLIGGCCGTTPEFIKALKREADNIRPADTVEKRLGVITSAVRYINPESINVDNIYKLDVSQNQELAEALQNDDTSWMEDTAMDLAAEDYDAIYIRISKESGYSTILRDLVDKLQWYIRSPFIIETDDETALNETLRIYRGVAGVVIGDSSADRLKVVSEKYGSVNLTNMSRFFKGGL